VSDKLKRVQAYGQSQAQGMEDQLKGALGQMLALGGGVRNMMQGSPADTLLNMMGMPASNPMEQPKTMQDIMQQVMWDAMDASMGGQIKAFHGSPYKGIKQFKMSKMGSGTGGQMFGWGGYFSDLGEVGRYYKNLARDTNYDSRLWKIRSDPELDKIYNQAGDDLANITHNFDEVDVLIEIDNAVHSKGKNQHFQSDTLDLIMKNKDALSPRGGALYDATLHKGKTPDQYDYMDWYEPITKDQVKKISDNIHDELIKWTDFSESRSLAEELQSKMVTTKLMRNKSGAITQSESYNTGDVVYHWLSHFLGGQREASTFLKRAGIDGNRYPTGTLSGKAKTGRKGPYNYVVFDEADITMEKALE